MTPVVVIGGYLGAGKTTLVNHLLRHAGGRRIAVLVNDFGSVSIDADLIEGAADGVLALAGGCVCCSFGADLVGTLERALVRTPAPDSVLVECSGVGLPGAVARTAALARGVRVDGVVVVADAAELPRLLRDAYVGDTVRAQLDDADLLLLNQADRVPPAALVALRAELQPRMSGAPMATTWHAEVPPELVLGLEATAHARTGWLGHGAPPQAPAATRRFRFDVMRVDGGVDPAALAARLAAPDTGLLRAKGVVRGLDGRRWLVQVMGRRAVVQPAPGGDAAQAHDGTLAVIAAAKDG